MSDYSLPYIASYGLPRVASAIRALAEQQRIANLIALGVISGGPLTCPDPPGDHARYLREQYPEIAAVLGLREEQEA